jgi:hypothetical protein
MIPESPFAVAIIDATKVRVSVEAATSVLQESGI